MTGLQTFFLKAGCLVGSALAIHMASFGDIDAWAKALHQAQPLGKSGTTYFTAPDSIYDSIMDHFPEAG